MLNSGSFLQNRYEIISLIGSGGMADVYKALDHKLNRYVAIKVLKAEFRGDASFVSKFRVEAQAAAGLSHSNIVNVYDVGDENGVYFIVMELVEGITLKDYIRSKGRLSVRETTGITLQVASGLEAAHNNGIIHRDVKPQNIIISVDGTAKVADFGIARAASSDTINSGVMGSVHYSAPEQSRGGYSDAKSDIYSLGITMYEMLTGQVPFDGDSTVEVALKHLQEKIVPPGRLVPGLPRAIEAIIMKCTQKSPDRRYANMTELIRDLKESLVNPNGDFVRIGTAAFGSTHLYTREELEEINRRRAQSQTPLFDDEETEEGDGGSGGSSLDEFDSDDIWDEDEDEDEDDGEGHVRTRTKEKKKSRSGRESRGGGQSKGRRERHSRSLVILTAAVALGAAVILIAVLIQRSAQHLRDEGLLSSGETETLEALPDGMKRVPDVRGMSEESACRQLRKQGFEYRYAGEAASGEYAEGTVAKLTPEAGAAAAEGSVVSYTISTGSGEAVVLPDLTNYTEAKAEEALKALGLKVSVDTTRFNNYIEEGSVITTNPGPESTVYEGDTVTLYVSQGKNTEQVKVPDVEDHYENDAVTMLRNSLLYPFVSHTESSTVPKGIVISQDIAGGEMVEQGTPVTITVSTGPGEGETSADGEADDSSGGAIWVFDGYLAEPSGYQREPVRITLEQNGVARTLFEGVTTFPYHIYVEGMPGVTDGTAYVYTLDPDTGAVTQTTSYALTFTEVD